MKSKLLTVFFALLSGICFSQTNIFGGAVNGTWTLAGSPYLIQGPIMIANGTTLSIEPGVHVEFQGSYKFLILGQLLAVGTVADTIVFTAADTSVGWLGIRYENTDVTNDTSEFVYCKFQYGKAVISNNAGGALYFNHFSKAKISHSLIIDCYSWGPGGGIYLNYSSVIISYCNLINNWALDAGGGIYCNEGSPIISFTNFFYNTSNGGESGGAISCFYGSPVITNNIISNNTGNGWGGGVYCYSSDATISNNIISYNAATSGGGIYSQSGFNGPLIIFNVISNNSAITNGGGLLCENCEISNSTVINNTAVKGGGIYSISLGSQLITNTTISNNISDKGGALYCDYSNPIFSNCIFRNDSATVSGNEVYLEDEPSDPDFSYCNVQHGPSAFGYPLNIFFTGIYFNNIDSNPQFINPSLGNGVGFDGVNADWSLQGISPCYNAGDPNGVYPPTDLAGNQRISNGRIDMGAYEYQFQTDVEKFILPNSFTVAPNPASNYFSIRFDPEFIDARVEVSDMFGKNVFEENMKNLTDGKLNVEMFASGIYFVSVYSDKKSFVRKLIVEHQ